MKIAAISFKNQNNFSKIQEFSQLNKWQTSSSADNKTNFVQPLQSQDTKTYVIGAAAIALLILAILKRKSIAKIFRGKNNPTNNRPPTPPAGENLGLGGERPPFGGGSGGGITPPKRPTAPEPPSFPTDSHGGLSQNSHPTTPGNPPLNGGAVVQGPAITSDIKRDLAEVYAEKEKFYQVHKTLNKNNYMIMKELNSRESELIKIAREKNISVLQKREFSLDPHIDTDKKYNYIFKTVIPNMQINEATALDALEMFEKYGDRVLGPNAVYQNDMFETSLHLMAMNISHCVSDVNHSPKLFDRFLEIFKKFAQKDAVYFRDNEALELMFINCDKMAPKQVADYIDVLSSIAVHKADLQFVKNHINTDTFPHKDNPIVTEALDRLADAVKDLPDNVPFAPIK